MLISLFGVSADESFLFFNFTVNILYVSTKKNQYLFPYIFHTAKFQSYCHKEDCGKFHHNDISPNLPSNDNSSTSILAIRNTLRQFAHPIRDFLPSPFNTFDVTGILVLIFVLVALSLHLINVCCCPESGISLSQKVFLSSMQIILGRDMVDQKLLHDCMTRLKEQQIALNNYQVCTLYCNV